MGTSNRSQLKKATVTATIATGIGLFLLSPQGVEAALGDRTLQPGMTHQDVKELQDLLKQKGYFTFHTSTGFYGDITKAAVERFQQAHHLPKTGIADANTLNTLLNDAQATLRVGSRGQAVTNLQNDLRALGTFNHATTGYFGPITEAAVKEFQLRNGLRATGIADSATLDGIKRIRANGTQQQTQETSRSATSQTTLQIGSRGNAVSEVQTLLKDANLFNYHTITGYYGEITATGVRDFQRQANLQVTGRADTQTVQALRDHVQKLKQQQAAAQPSQTVSTPTVQSESSFVLKVGQTSDSVRELQHQLKSLGYFNHQVTGYFGPITETAVRAFQRDHQLIVDGVVTTSTLNKIVDEAAKKLLPAIVLPSETAKSFDVMNLIADASQLLGTPYLWGGTTSRGMDCSGFIQYVFQKNGVQLPRTVAQMWNVGSTVSKPKVGDLVFFETYTRGPSHAGIYIGNNQFIHSGSSTGVTISNMTTNYWSSRYLGSKTYQ
ncbi:C40 family peptidase [Anaerobacillus alkalidiazotrophicus]|uniref:C40 family peptidase n=1 Tax=Anaerobacillus alkalidiazotrophicus TaxID=472963 RepID=UPI000A052516|nr:peptidoglycan-binding protein [Anaerobacillus alkalidiazotrophicus]